jgi:predicted CXXCH cytochrome family protein
MALQSKTQTMPSVTGIICSLVRQRGAQMAETYSTPETGPNRMLTRNLLNTVILWLLWIVACPGLAAQQPPLCVRCHVAPQTDPTDAHREIAQDCILCHAGNPAARTKAGAHRGLIAYPGDMDSAARACNGCHADKVAGVRRSLMRTGIGIVTATRKAFGESTDRPGHNDLDHLTHTPADSLLRKQCASCHLGQKKTAHRLDATLDRGGGCLACHINEQSPQAHPILTARVSDARCFGCHSRSGRISLAYAGLAETDQTGSGTSRLADGRSVLARPDDRHHAAGMSCIDCHTERDLMGVGAEPTPTRAKQAVDIACVDCHAITHTIACAQWPGRYRNLLKRIPYPTDAQTHIAVTAGGTPLWNIELRGDSAWLHRKDGQGRLRIPPYLADKHPLEKQHSLLKCAACHSQWAPQCYGCHMDYDPRASQYDHAAHRDTPGRWNSQMSDIRNTLPPLGVDSDNRIVPVLPGMVMTVRHPDWPRQLFQRHFQAIEPHTTGPARSCASCHHTASALGLGEGELIRQNGKLRLRPTHPNLEDGLPADAWTRLDLTVRQGDPAEVRPFSRQEMKRILGVP